ncbi:MAG: hypothetical protein WC465_04240 [Patescibacteria group bacterium]
MEDKCFSTGSGSDPGIEPDCSGSTTPISDGQPPPEVLPRSRRPGPIFPDIGSSGGPDQHLPGV